MTYRYKSKGEDVTVRGLLLRKNDWRISNIRLPFSAEEEKLMIIETSEDGTFSKPKKDKEPKVELPVDEPKVELPVDEPKVELPVDEPKVEKPVNKPGNSSKAKG
jgi:hypothetical protein